VAAQACHSAFARDLLACYLGMCHFRFIHECALQSAFLPPAVFSNRSGQQHVAAQQQSCNVMSTALSTSTMLRQTVRLWGEGPSSVTCPQGHTTTSHSAGTLEDKRRAFLPQRGSPGHQGLQTSHLSQGVVAARGGSRGRIVPRVSTSAVGKR
jgi:hypothetical protein